MRIESVCILGGTGFVGRHIANLLGNTRVSIKVLTGRRERNKHLLPIPNLQLVEADVHDPDTLVREFRGVDAVINLVGVLNDSPVKGRGFQSAHVDLPASVIEACRSTGVGRLLHMSALGASPDAESRYQQTKAEGERIVRDAHGEDLAVSIYRPSVIFGPEDKFLNTFADLLRIAPIFFVPTPEARFRPVYVTDVARAFTQSLARRETFGQTFELCGPQTYTLEELVRYCARVMDLDRTIVGLSDRMSRLQARILEKVPGKPYSYENYLASKIDNVCTEDGLAALGIHPTALETVVPRYLGRTGARQRYNRFRRLARR